MSKCQHRQVLSVKLVLAWLSLHVPFQSNTTKSNLLFLALLHLWSRMEKKQELGSLGGEGVFLAFRCWPSLFHWGQQCQALQPHGWASFWEASYTLMGFSFFPSSEIAPWSQIPIVWKPCWNVTFPAHGGHMLNFPPNVYGGLRSVLEGVSVGLGRPLHTKSL